MSDLFSQVTTISQFSTDVNSTGLTVIRKSSVSFLFNEIADISAQKEIEKDVKDASLYSLDKPVCVVNAIFDDGEYVIKAGGKTTEGTQFLMINNDVYLVSSSKADTFLNPLSYYREKNILEVDTQSLSYISYKYNGDVVTLEKKKDLDEWIITSPIGENADFGSINEKILSQIGNLKINKFVDDSLKDYKKYDIGENYLYLKDTASKEQKIFIGAKKDGEYFIKCQNNGCVYSCASDAISFVELKAADYTNKFVALVNVKDIKNVEIYDLTQNKNYNLAPLFEGKKETYKIDGIEVVKEKFTDAYQKVIGIMFTDFSNGKEKGEKQYTIKYNMLDNSTKTVDFYTYKDRKHIAVLDNRYSYEVLSGYLSDMIAALNKAAEK